jgi:hypothetical protein
MDNQNKIENILKRQGYNFVKEDFPKELTWEPDLLTRRKGELFAFLIRKANDIPEVFVQRIAETKLTKNKIHIGIIFCKKPKLNSIKLISLYGIGAFYLSGNTLIEISRSKLRLSRKTGISKPRKEKIKKMPHTDIFVSSHQVIAERGNAKKIIDKLRNDYQFPIFAILIEEDSRYPINKTKKCIHENMARAEMFVGIIAEQYRPIVSYEIKRAFNAAFKSRDILIFVKTLKLRSVLLDGLIKWIEQRNTVKYLEYTDERDFNSKLEKALMIKIRNIHKRLNIPFME